MKRTPIKRKTSLKRSAIRWKPKPFTGVDDRDQFEQEFNRCWACNQRKREQVHHIFGRNSPDKHHRTNLFAVCAKCHFDKIPGLPTLAQVGIKLVNDPHGFDLVVLERISGWKNGNKNLENLRIAYERLRNGEDRPNTT